MAISLTPNFSWVRCVQRAFQPLQRFPSAAASQVMYASEAAISTEGSSGNDFDRAIRRNKEQGFNPTGGCELFGGCFPISEWIYTCREVLEITKQKNMKFILLLISVVTLLTAGCIFPGPRGGGEYRGGEGYRGHEEYRHGDDHPGYHGHPEPGVDIRIHGE